MAATPAATTPIQVATRILGTTSGAGHLQIGDDSLLNGLAAAESILPETAAQITSTLQSIVVVVVVVAGAAPNASPEARIRVDEVARLVDAASPGPAVVPPT